MKIKSKKKIEKHKKTYNLHVKNNHNYFANNVLVSNCHTAKSKSLQDISNNCINAKWRIGLSGTYPDKNSVDWYTIVGSTGPIKKFVNYKKLKEDNRVAGLEIKDLFLMHDPEVCKKNFFENSKNFQAEIDFINNLQNRNEFVAKLASKLDQNTIVLFTRIQHGKDIKQLITDVVDTKKVLYVDGSTPAIDRENIRTVMENSSPIHRIWFGEKYLDVESCSIVPLSNGTSKLAKEITIDDDIDDSWISNRKLKTSKKNQ